ncbi:MAG: type II CRISPR RNA-guided endonuclease Cas9 [Verrucomicrobiota bacterium]
MSLPINRLVGEHCPLPKLPKVFPSEVDEDLSLGIDIGIGSCGLALVSKTADAPTIRGFEWMDGAIRFMGVRAFDVPETKEKTGPKLKNPDRRQARLVRRGVARRALRMRAIRALLRSNAVLPPEYSINLPEWQEKHQTSVPWQWRVDGLERKLDLWEWAAVLIHFAKHRGFRSNRKSDLAAKGEAGGVLESSKANHEALEQYRTLGEMFVKDPRFAERKRNRDGSYVSVILRADLIGEIRTLFAAQRSFGSAHAAENFENEYIAIVQMQRPLQDPVKLLDDCPFEPLEKRGSRHAPSFELSRALQRLNTLVLVDERQNEVPLPLHAKGQPGIYERFMADFGLTKKISWKSLRKTFAIPDHLSFRDVSGGGAKGKKSSKEMTEADDFVNRGGKGCAYSTALFREVFQDQWGTFLQNGFELLDEAAFALTFYEVIEDGESPNTILAQIAERCAENSEVEARIRENLFSEKPALSGFSGRVSVSARASRNIIPHLATGLVYDKAMDAAGYRHTDSNLNLKSITNPVVKSVVREAMKQIVHLICETGKIPGKINVELARDMGKGIEERNEIKRGLDKRTTERNVNRGHAAEILEIPEERVSDEELLKFELFFKQGGLCPYSGDIIQRDRSLFSAHYQIDHILPRSRSHDNSYDNRVLVTTKSNHNKKQRSPYEWLGGPDSKAWLDFTVRVQAMRGIRGRKKRNLLETRLAEKEDEFLARNLNDTRYISRVITAFLEDIYVLAGQKPLRDKGSRRRVFVRPGALTSLVRKAWGLQDLKKDLTGKRLGDKHHAVDALICACIGEKDLHFITALSKAWGAMENLHEHRLVPVKLPQPWDGFRQTVVAVLERITVSRREDCGGRGAVHKDTVYGRDADGVFWKRVPLVVVVKNKKSTFLNDKDLLETIRGARRKDVEKQPQYRWFRDSLSRWIEAGSPVEAPPLNPEGKPVDKVFRVPKTSALQQIDRGWVTNGNLIRCDIFKNGTKFHAVPVYSHQLFHLKPPSQYAVNGKDPSDWPEVSDEFEFQFSLWKNSRFQIHTKETKKTVGKVIEGTYITFDYDSRRVDYHLPDDFSFKIGGEGKTQKFPRVTIGDDVTHFQKLHVDRLGRVFPIPREKRTWRGKVFT